MPRADPTSPNTQPSVSRTAILSDSTAAKTDGTTRKMNTSKTPQILTDEVTTNAKLP